MIFYYFILKYKELTLQKLRKYYDNLLGQYFIILKIKRNSMPAHIYKKQSQSFKPNWPFKK